MSIVCPLLMGSIWVLVASPLFRFSGTLIESTLPWLTVLLLEWLLYLDWLLLLWYLKVFCFDLTALHFLIVLYLGLTVNVLFHSLTVLHFGWKCCNWVWLYTTLVESALPWFDRALVWLKLLYLGLTVLYFGWKHSIWVWQRFTLAERTFSTLV